MSIFDQIQQKIKRKEKFSWNLSGFSDFKELKHSFYTSKIEEIGWCIQSIAKKGLYDESIIISFDASNSDKIVVYHE